MGFPNYNYKHKYRQVQGVGEGNTEKGWNAAKIDDQNKIFNISFICCTFIKFKRKI